MRFSVLSQPGVAVAEGTIRVARDLDNDLVITKNYSSGSQGDSVYVEGPTVVAFVDAVKAMFPAKFATHVATPKPAKARPHGAQEYRGNGSHTWEVVVESRSNGGRPVRPVKRLRVPGGWLYKPMGSSPVFVPMPTTVGYGV